MRKEDYISYSQLPNMCPGNIDTLNRFHKTKPFNYLTKNIKEGSLSLLKELYKNPLADIYNKIETVRYGVYYNRLPQALMTQKELIELHNTFIKIKLVKGLTFTARMGCHNIYNQILKLFDFALMRDRANPLDSEEVVLGLHKELADRDPAYKAHYNFLLSNPKLTNKLKAFVFQNHDDLLLMMLSTLSTINKLDIDIPFASALSFELHKELNDYYVKIEYNGKPIKMERCNSLKCSLSNFIDTIMAKGMYKDDETFISKCRNNTS